ncbi:DNA-binding transcriptional LysR family regulator [Luteibacter rhizovicinus]|uniref:DNA-binding transcriptional LysR family regulator n=1 Tax=Luteibacter rhizovicinus TaxID=242606 RepID=A0A4R3YX01_9GAMM|nr:LysR family transcriptional regulator [Luteibacter rhizovicinus]TCV97056.1 DNA-binding transcriptional LysR family regulator [Luteibacter rhizovicinus]
MHRSGLIELEAVLAVARRGSFRAAAAELGMSTSAISNAIAALETRLRTRLFNRTTRSVALTEAGQQFVVRISPALGEINGAMDEVNSQRQTPTGTLRINSSVGAARMIFAPLVLEFLRRHSDMKVDIVTEARLVDIVADGFDAGIRLEESVPRDMIAVPIGPDLRMVAVASPGYFAQHAKPLVPGDLMAHDCIRMRLSHGGIYRWELERHGEALELDVQGPLILDEATMMVDAAREGFGIAFVSEWNAADDLATGRLIRVLEDWSPYFPGLRLYYPGHRHVPPGLRAFVDLIREVNEARVSKGQDGSAIGPQNFSSN